MSVKNACSTGPKNGSMKSVLMGAAALSLTWYWGQRVSVPRGVEPVQDFDVGRYMGHWYEIARIDFMFERGLTSCTAQYDLANDGTVSVTNRGFDPAKGRWKTAQAVAQFLGDPQRGALKVSFFRPFYAGYNVVYISEDYAHAVVVGDKTKYCWILSRSPSMSESQYADLLAIAEHNGVDTRQMLRVAHGADWAQAE